MRAHAGQLRQLRGRRRAGALQAQFARRWLDVSRVSALESQHVEVEVDVPAPRDASVSAARPLRRRASTSQTCESSGRTADRLTRCATRQAAKLWFSGLFGLEIELCGRGQSSLVEGVLPEGAFAIDPMQEDVGGPTVRIWCDAPVAEVDALVQHRVAWA